MGRVNMKRRLGKHQKMLLSYLYKNGKKTLRDFVDDNRLGYLETTSREKKIEIYLTMSEKAQDVLFKKIHEDDTKAINLYFTLWNTVKILRKAGLITTSERTYHRYRELELTEAGKEFVWEREVKPEMVEKVERCRRCSKCNGYSAIYPKITKDFKIDCEEGKDFRTCEYPSGAYKRYRL
jgi:hypothetical protein